MSIIQQIIDKLHDADIGIAFGAGEYLGDTQNDVAGKVTFAGSIDLNKQFIPRNVLGNGLIKSEVVKVWLKSNSYIGLEVVLGKVQEILAQNGFIPVSGFEYIEPHQDGNLQMALSFKLTGQQVMVGDGEGGSGGNVELSNDMPLMNGSPQAGTDSKASRGDHIHPSDTSKQDILVSGDNIATINGQSLLQGGDILISDGDSGGISQETDPIYTADKASIALKVDVTTEIATAVGNIVSDEIEPMQEVLTQVTQEINELDDRVADLETRPMPQIYEYDIRASGSWINPSAVSFDEYHIGYYSSNPNLATIDDVMAEFGGVPNAFPFFFSRFVNLHGVVFGNFWLYGTSTKQVAFNYIDAAGTNFQKLNCYPNDGSDETNVSFTVIRKRQIINI